MTNEKRISELRAQLDDVYSRMPSTFAEQKNRDRAAFEISRELEKLKSPEEYEKNKAHWENHETRF